MQIAVFKMDLHCGIGYLTPTQGTSKGVFTLKLFEGRKVTYGTAQLIHGSAVILARQTSNNEPLSQTSPEAGPKRDKTSS